ncbi:MAG: archaeal proteasome endopeptidase complex subunit alpha [Candidatus Hydrothermarchaeota archaeon]|nr:archaeal proteasome endopeptidase complex subunit alpha [Candidatus Hydrothermarchaeota archaeon]MDP6613018.1 archaeal proteasome endopeptidase complex subunit alpha [Candidatus Hydrothermarchaeota archaeon]
MQPMPSMGYDRAITVFSPDGRLFQVEYAREAVKRGTTSLGIRYKDGVVLAIDKRITSRLVEAESIEKIFHVDAHIGAATSGLVADARVLIDRARVEAQTNRITYNEPIAIEILAKKICDFKQLYTQHGGVRPFGLALLIAGVNNAPRLFETDPSGALIEYKATAIGMGRTTAMEIFEEKYMDDLNRDAAINLALAVMNEITDGKLSGETVEMALIELKTKQFRKLTQEEVEEHISKIKESSKKSEE